MSYAHPEYLISTEELKSLITAGNESLRIFDATIHLKPAKNGYQAVSGREDYEAGHIPGAAFMDLAGDFAEKNSKFNFMMPSDEVLAKACRSAGINRNARIVLYSSGHMMWATRAWWMLYSLGHTNVAVLNGGLITWKKEGRPLSTETINNPQGDFVPERNPARWADKSVVLAAIEDGDTCTINALSPEVYSGAAQMHYGRKGHITGSINVFYDDVLEKGCFRPATDIRDTFSAKGILDKPRTIAYCGGGISATIDALALALIGYENVAVYDGSMGEWAADQSLPLVEGES